jgi:hypothetical protein
MHFNQRRRRPGASDGESKKKARRDFDLVALKASGIHLGRLQSNAICESVKMH